jgi:hypothetical protein
VEKRRQQHRPLVGFRSSRQRHLRGVAASALRRQPKREGVERMDSTPARRVLGGSSVGLLGQNRPAEWPAGVFACFKLDREFTPKNRPKPQKMMLPNEA